MGSSYCEKQVATHTKKNVASYNTLQVYSRLNHLNLCVSYQSTLRLMNELSLSHKIPLEKWIEEGVLV